MNLSNGVDSIGYGAFEYCGSLTSVTIPESVTSIEERTFQYCSSLASVTIGEGVTSIGEEAFYECRSLTSVTIPERDASIGTSAFSHCSSLTSVNLSNGVDSIGAYAFYYCGSLTSVTIPEGVTSIGDRAFFSVSTLHYDAVDCEVNGYSWANIRTLTIGEQVKKVPAAAFRNCDELTTVTILKTIPSFESKAFEDCESLDAVYYEGDLAEWCSISFADGYANPLCYGADLYIGQWSLLPEQQVTATPELTLPEGIKHIADYAFYGCNLQSVVLPSSLESIGVGIIDSTDLRSITCYADYPPTCTEASFAGVDKSILLYVPEVGLDYYWQHAVWNKFYNMRPFKKNGLDTPALAEAITVVNGEVHLNLPGTFEAQVYDLQGRHVLSTTERHFALPQGTYIIKVGDEAMKLPVIL